MRIIYFILIFSSILSLFSYFSFKRILFTESISLVFFSVLFSFLATLFYLVTHRLKNKILTRIFNYFTFSYLGFITLGISYYLVYNFLEEYIFTIELIQTGINRLKSTFFILDYFAKNSYQIILFVLFSIGLYQGFRTPKIKKRKITISNTLSELEGLKIVQISDLHIGPLIQKKFVQKVVEQINSLDADFLFITGDLVDGSFDKYSEHLSPLEFVKTKYGVFYVTGNHEYYSGVMKWIQKFKEIGFVVLLNSNSVINIKNTKLLIAGVTDLKAGNFIDSHKTNPSLASHTIEKVDYKILLAHQPNSIFEASKYNFDLQFSGHTHGGQYFPSTILIYLFQKFVSGFYKYKNTLLYVSKGTGYWGPPLRLGASPEITYFELKRSTL